MIPLSAEVYFASLAEFNEGTFWLIIAFMIAGIGLIAAPGWLRHNWFRLATAVLAAAWLHLGLNYHLGFFAALNFWDYPLGALCILQAALLLWLGVFRGGEDWPTSISMDTDIMVISLVLLPAIGWLSGHPWEEIGYFGAAPGPTLFFTAGVLMSARGIAKLLWLTPVLLAIPALVMAVSIPVWQDFILMFMPVLAVYAIFWRRKKQEV